MTALPAPPRSRFHRILEPAVENSRHNLPVLEAMLRSLVEHPFNPWVQIHPGARWAVDVLLPSAFLPRFTRDRLAEGFTTIDGAVGCFDRMTDRGHIALLPGSTQVVVF